MDTSIVVDKSRGEKLTVNMGITFPHVPCYRMRIKFSLLSVANHASHSSQLGRDGYIW